MKSVISRVFASAVVMIALSTSAASAVYAQGSDPAAANATQSSQTTKTQRKAARKEARAKKNAELKKLEDAGYNPGRASDPKYPQDIQDAEKKAGLGAKPVQ